MISFVGLFLVVAGLALSATPMDGSEEWDKEAYACLLAGIGLFLIVFL